MDLFVKIGFPGALLVFAFVCALRQRRAYSQLSTTLPRSSTQLKDSQQKITELTEAGPAQQTSSLQAGSMLLQDKQKSVETEDGPAEASLQQDWPQSSLRSLPQPPTEATGTLTPDSQEVEFRKRQLRRREKTSLLVGALAVGLWIGLAIPPQMAALYLLFWCVIGLVTAWIGLLAVGDLVLVHRQRARLLRKLAAHRREWEQEYRRLRLQQLHLEQASSNGHSRSSGPPEGLAGPTSDQGDD